MEEIAVRTAIKNFRDLEIWQKARILVKSVYQLTRQFPRAAVAIPSNIAEGRSRNSTRDFFQFLSFAIGSPAEVENASIACRGFELRPDQGYYSRYLRHPFAAADAACLPKFAQIQALANAPNP